MEKRNLNKTFEEITEKTYESEHGSVDEVDRAQNYQKIVIKKSVKQYSYHDLNKSESGGSLSAGTASNGREQSPLSDSAYQTFPVSISTTAGPSSQSDTLSHSSSFASCEHLPSEENIFSTSTPTTSKQYSTRINILLHGNKDSAEKTHEWYNQYTSQAFHQSPLTSRSHNTSSKFEFDTHIAQIRGKKSYFKITAFLLFSNYLLSEND
jgi:hypothetical protein